MFEPDFERNEFPLAYLITSGSHNPSHGRLTMSSMDRVIFPASTTNELRRFLTGVVFSLSDLHPL